MISNYANVSGTSATFDLTITGFGTTPIVIFDSNSATSISINAGAGFATFDGSGGTYLTRAALNATKTYPFWVSMFIRMYERFDFGTSYCVYASERADGSQGTAGIVQSCVPYAQTADGTSFSSAISQEAVIPNPHWDNVVFEYRSATDRRVWINGVQEGTNSTSRVIDLSAGSPVTQIGKRAAAGQAFRGGIAHLAFGTGTLTTADRTLLATFGADYTGVAPTSGSIANWYPLLSSGKDVIGGSDMSPSGTVVFDTSVVGNPAPPTRATAIYEVHKQSSLLPAMPTIVTAQSSPVSISGWTNLSHVEFLDIAFAGNVSAWNTRVYHYVPIINAVAGGHVVMMDPGHSVISEWATYNADDVIQQLVAAGYAVAVTQLPLEGPTDPGYTGSGQVHDAFWALYDSTHNPLERWHGPNAIAMNYLAPRYGKRSIVGLSGGACRAAHYAALDSRINHACVPIRGVIADRRVIISGLDFEQRPLPNGWKTEEFFKLAASGNIRLWFVHHPTDTCCFGQFADPSGSPGGAYLDATDYDTQFLAPLRATYPLADVQILIDQGSATHAYTQWTIDNAILPAVSRPLKAVSSRPRPLERLGLRAA